MQPVIAEIVRSGVVEGHHYGAVVALDPDGRVVFAHGDVTGPVLPRSCNKPLQAAAMVRHGLDLTDELLALAGASHSGEPFHVAGVRRILDHAGLSEDALGNPVGWPLEDRVRDEVVRSGGTPTRLHMNCSGKHAAMLLTCVRNDWPLAGYLATDHPLQLAIAADFARQTGEAVGAVAVDGCGAPLLPTSLTGLARAFGRLAVGADDAAASVAGAIRRYPAYVSGTERDERRLLDAIPGAIAKAGAEGCYAVALADGRAVALKIDDGGFRARPVVMAAVLRRLGIDTEAGVDTEAVRRMGAAPLTGGDAVVGEIRAALAP
jgi:L-asparaginase II